MNEPQWLHWSRQLQAIAQTGLAFTVNPYDIERYEALRTLAAEIMAAHTSSTAESIEALFRAENGYPTPKIDVRAAVFDGEGRILMVREASDGHRWTLPGGWADVNLSSAESAVKEVREESGYEARILRPAAMWDRARICSHRPVVGSHAAAADRADVRAPRRCASAGGLRIALMHAGPAWRRISAAFLPGRFGRCAQSNCCW
jgi:ADP-ribose pyrophosphatase YjhB (NUDIX family)